MGRKRAKLEQRETGIKEKWNEDISSIARSIDSRNTVMLLSMPGGTEKSKKALEVLREEACEKVLREHSRKPLDTSDDQVHVVE